MEPRPSRLRRSKASRIESRIGSKRQVDVYSADTQTRDQSDPTIRREKNKQKNQTHTQNAQKRGAPSTVAAPPISASQFRHMPKCTLNQNESAEFVVPYESFIGQLTASIGLPYSESNLLKA